MPFLKLVLSKIFTGIAVFLGIKYAENRGRDKERLENAERFKDSAIDAQKIDDSVRRANNNDVDDWLQR